MVVWKANLDFGLAGDEQLIDMPVGSNILSVAIQHNKIAVWFEAPEDTVMTKRKFVVVETGKNVPKSSKFIGTVMILKDSYVVHVYDAGELLYP